MRFERMAGSLCRVERRGRQVDVVMSDYLEDAPRDALDEYERLLRSDPRSQPPESLVRYVSSDAFLLSKRPVFLSRSRKFTMSSEGEFRSLSDSVQRLLDAGMVSEEDLDGVYITWTRVPSVRILGTCHYLFRVVSISSALDSERVSEDCLDFVVYHELLHVRQGLRTGRRKHDADFKRQEAEFPDSGRIRRELATLRN